MKNASISDAPEIGFNPSLGTMFTTRHMAPAAAIENAAMRASQA